MGSNSMNTNFIRIDSLDVPLYRTFRFRYLREVLQERKLPLLAPHLWDDPFENVLTKCCITYKQDDKFKQEFFDRVRKPIYAQCWSLSVESDALWRIYSIVVKDSVSGRNTTVEEEGIKVRTTARKLLSALWNACPTAPGDSCFLGQVEYLSQKKAVQRIADEVGRTRLNAFPGGVGHAMIMLVKREPFNHEQEVRLIYVEHRKEQGNDPLFFINVDPSKLIEKIILDPRLSADDVKEREAELRCLGFRGPIVKSELYQGVLYEIFI